MSSTERTLPRIQVFSRRGCHLCEQLIDELATLVRGRLELEVKDVDENEQWRHAYGEFVPVVRYNGQEVCRYHLDRASIIRILAQESANI